MISGAGISVAETAGLAFDTGSGTLSEFEIVGFSGDGIRIGDGIEVTLDGVGISGNCGWGVRTRSRLVIRKGVGSVTMIGDNGSSEGCNAGGILAAGPDARVEGSGLSVSGNKGPGILSSGPVAVASVVIADNGGPGISTFDEAAIVGGDDNRISGNRGAGVIASRGVRIQEAVVEIAGNGGWGVHAAGGNLSINAGPVNPEPGNLVRITGNGVGAGCTSWSIDGQGEIESGTAECRGGGIVRRIQSDDSDAVVNATITGNAGPGVFTVSNVSLGAVKVNENRGPGIRADVEGAVSIFRGTDNQVRMNQGAGIYAGQGLTVKEAAVDVSDNLGWGIRAPGGNVAINSGVFTPGPATAVSINRNGLGGDCFIWDVDESGNLTVDKEQCEGGGVLRVDETSDPDSAQNVEIIGNGGPGILTVGNLELGIVKISDNAGPGVHSQLVGADGGSVRLVLGADNQIAGNLGDGIFAENGIEIKESRVDISGNAGWGIRIRAGEISINREPSDRAASETLVTVTGNGASPRCVAWSITDDRGDAVHREEDCAGGGLLRTEKTDVSDGIGNAEITGNDGPGIRTPADVNIESSKVNENKGDGINGGDAVTARFSEVCRNTGDGIIAGSEPELIETNVCDNEKSQVRVRNGEVGA